MADVFISYAREDRAFVVLLHEALTKAGREGWGDWKDIPPTAAWKKEIEAAIEAAHSFIFVISQDSAASSVCREELEHAVRHNKRLIPVVRGDVEEAAVPEVLRKINWLFFRENDDFETSFQTLLHAIDTDLDWVRVHTRLLTRAIEWDCEKHDKSFLLRGKDLQEAEQWLAQGGQKDRNPTSLQIQYIQAGRKASTDSQRRTIGAVTFGMIVASALAALAWYLYTVSEQRSKIALSRQIAVEAKSEIPVEGKKRGDNDIPRALLLASEAVRLSPTLEARSALLGALFFQPHELRFLWEDQNILSVAISSDDGKILAALSDGIIVRWDPKTGQSSLGKKLDAQEVGLATAVFSPSGRILAYQNGETIVSENIALGKTKSLPIRVSKDSRCGLAFSPDERFLAVVKPDTSSVVWDVVGEQIWKELPSVHPQSDEHHLAAALDVKGETLALSSTAGFSSTIAVWNVGEAKLLWTRDPRFVVTSLALHGTSLAAVGGFFPGSSGAPQPQELIVLDLKKNKIIGRSTREATNPTSSVAFGPDGDTIAAGYSNGVVVLLYTSRPGDGTLEQGETLYGLPDDIDFIAFGHEQETVVVGSKNYIEVVYMSEASSLETEQKAKGEFGQGFKFPEAHRLDPYATSPGGEIVAFLDGETVTLWDSITGKTVGNPLNVGEFSHVALSPNGKKLAIIREESTVEENTEEKAAVILFDVATNKPEGEFLGAAARGGIPAFSPDGKILAIGEGNEITLWDVATRKKTGQLSSTRPLGSFTSLIFSPNGNIIVSGHFKTADIILWDIAAQKPLDVPLNCGPHEMTDGQLSVSRDAKTLFLAIGLEAFACDLDPDSWAKRACRITNRNLTRQEWQQYFGSEPYRETCDLPRSLPSG
jgi:WD40 repeat protein